MIVSSLQKIARKGFTLAEILIALLILAEIASFTIPKILIGQQNAQFNAKAKEVAGMVSEAYMRYQQTNSPVSINVGMEDLTPYMNYVAVDSTSTIDNVQNAGFNACDGSSAGRCLRLHNGGIFRYGRSVTYNFGGTSAIDKVWFVLDPDVLMMEQPMVRAKR